MADNRLTAFAGATEWLNTDPLGPDDLRGHVVLVNFWTLTCINWLRQEPYVRAWSKAYRDDGLIVIGAHTPEFQFEKDSFRIKQAVEQYAIDYPVAVDSNFRVWTAFANHYWPALYFLDREGVVKDEHFGEGRYAQSERVIQKLLGIERELVSVEGLGVGVEAEADWETLRTPETYVGADRRERLSPEDMPDGLNYWSLAGDWSTEHEAVALEDAGGSISFRFESRDVHVVLSRRSDSPIPFTITVDGKPPGESHGVDTDADGRGVLDAGRLYQLLREKSDVRERTIEITFEHAGAEVYSFTFG